MRCRQLNLRIDTKRLAHLDKMAAEAGVKPGALAKAMLEALIDDDEKAHRESEQNVEAA